MKEHEQNLKECVAMNDIKLSITSFLISFHQCYKCTIGYMFYSDKEDYLTSQKLKDQKIISFKILDDFEVVMYTSKKLFKYISLEFFLKKYFKITKQDYMCMLERIGFECL